MSININEKDFDFYSGFCHFIRTKEHNPIRHCTHFEGSVQCDMNNCPLIKQRLQDKIKYEKQTRENNNHTYQLKMSKEDVDNIPVFGKEKFKECKDYLKKMEIVDTHSKEYIEIQAYNKFAERILTRLRDNIATSKEMFKGNMYAEQSIKTINFVIDNIKDIRDELIKERS